MLKLRSYQEEDVEFIRQRVTCGIFNEQRTGKTPTTIIACHREKLNKVLIVCPTSAIPIWADEYVRWTRGRPAIMLTGTPEKRKELLNNWERGAAVISYGCLKTTKNTSGMLQQILDKHPDAVIIDEAHRIKNPKSLVTPAVFGLIKVPRRFALTGTPAPGKPHEIWSILHFLEPNVFRSYWKFIEEFFETSRKPGAGGRQYVDIGGFKPGKAEALQRILDRISIQRKRKHVMAWLPQKDYDIVRLPLTPAQKKYLKELKEVYETETVVVKGILDRLIRYRQICLHPGILDLKGSSPKSEWIMSYLDDYPDRPTIIFSKFTQYLHLLSDELKKNNSIKWGMIVGATSVLDRKKAVDDFQSGKLNVLLINIDAGKEALTLDRAVCTIFTDIYPPVSDIQQAEDRMVATTKERADKPHRVVYLAMKDSYDEQIYKLVKQRATATDLLNDYNKYLRGEH